MLGVAPIPIRCAQPGLLSKRVLRRRCSNHPEHIPAHMAARCHCDCVLGRGDSADRQLAAGSRCVSKIVCYRCAAVKEKRRGKINPSFRRVDDLNTPPKRGSTYR